MATRSKQSVAMLEECCPAALASPLSEGRASTLARDFAVLAWRPRLTVSFLDKDVVRREQVLGFGESVPRLTLRPRSTRHSHGAQSSATLRWHSQ